VALIFREAALLYHYITHTELHTKRMLLLGMYLLIFAPCLCVIVPW